MCVVISEWWQYTPCPPIRSCVAMIVWSGDFGLVNRLPHPQDDAAKRSIRCARSHRGDIKALATRHSAENAVVIGRGVAFQLDAEFHIRPSAIILCKKILNYGSSHQCQERPLFCQALFIGSRAASPASWASGFTAMNNTRAGRLPPESRKSEISMNSNESHKGTLSRRSEMRLDWRRWWLPAMCWGARAIRLPAINFASPPWAETMWPAAGPKRS